MDERLKDEHLEWLKEVKGVCDLSPGAVFLIEGGYTIHESMFTISSELYSKEERKALADLIRWGYCEWKGFIAGDLGCGITDAGREQLDEAVTVGLVT